MDDHDDIPEASDRSALKSWGLTALAAVAFWSVALAMATSYVRLEVRRIPHYPLEQLPFDAVVVLIGAAHCLLIRAVMERVVRRPFWIQAGVATALALALAMPFEWVMRGIVHLVFLDYHEPLPPVIPRVVVASTVFWGAPFGVWAVGLLALMHDAEARRRERRLIEAQARAHEAQVRALRYQVNPHFLYNTLNAIAALILDRRNDQAEAMVIRLSDFFRSSLAQDPLADVTLEREIALQRLYLEIEEVRFTDQLEVDIRLPQELEAALVPSLILQPLVENALKHGLRGPGEPMRLTITALAEADRLTLDVADNGRGSAASGGGTGVGLKNVERRLAARFQDDARLATDASPHGFHASVTLPLVFA
ncbi:MAG: histidine kinase [Alphaproteobacteria bacterium]|nr:histidine kinase [Alphaproteobacteria bacterium]MBU1517212.1 histidine kinase [Alphaproteobacteria bacterium]MBU2093252.1 histidine kinase [Alphaproteobacteria bacterium]MBU2153122.1 histidine kinase [Alphaproteobacteria bacterium]MBU2307828.1 histidine kinase [Alphaproteobacteria bacterium]